MAWPVERENGKWQGKYRDAMGVEQSAGVYTHKAQALREASRKESESREVGAIDPRAGRLLWGTWFTDWHGARSMAYATDENYRSVASNHLMPTWEYVALENITELNIEKWKKAMLTPKKKDAPPPNSPWVVRSALMLLKTSLNAAVRAKKIGASPAANVQYPDMPAGLERYLTPDEVESITFYMDGRNALVVWLSVETGLRFGEMAGLHWKRIDLDRGVIRIVEKFDQKSYLIDLLPKDNEERTVPLSPEMAGRLIQYRDSAAGEQRETCGLQHANGGRCLGDLVFRGARGAPLKSNDWGKTIFKKALGEAGIEGRVRPQDMRHTYASWLIQEGVSIAQLAALMGHSDWEVTQRYAHLGDAGFDDVRDALQRHKGVLGAAPGAAPKEDLEQRVARLEAMLLGSNSGSSAPFATLREASSMDDVQAS